ncbi:MAG: carboxypeptidase regulatory-like domain-containing protein [Planctomycetes bacterium]|nr:carboxypeptidase regulatory-like domain-containing protein [Planctomycetota bacterium]
MTESETPTVLKPPVSRGRRPSSRSELPFVFRPRVWLPVAVLGLLVWGGWLGITSWYASHTTFAVVSTAGVPLSGLSIEFFACEESSAGVSPTSRIGALESVSPELTVGWELSPGEALVRIRAEGHGVGSGYVRAGRDVQIIQLGPPVSLSGRVVRPAGESQDGLAEARVLALGGGARGVVLTEATTDADGAFELVGLSSAVPYLTLRVLAPGHGVAEATVAVDSGRVAPIEVTPTHSIGGRIVACEGVDVGDRPIVVYNLPGVTARTDSDGSFVLDHVPAMYERCRLLVAGLEPEFTHARCDAAPGDRDVEIVVERACHVVGVAVDALTRDPIRGTKVFHEHGPTGVEVVDCDEWGRFRLRRLPAGSAWITADVLVEERSLNRGYVRKQTKVRRGDALVDLDSGEVQTDVIVLIRPLPR